MNDAISLDFENYGNKISVNCPDEHDSEFLITIRNDGRKKSYSMTIEEAEHSTSFTNTTLKL